MSEKPVTAPEEQPAPEIRGGDRPADFIPQPPKGRLIGEAYVPYAHEDTELEDGAESYGEGPEE